MPSRRAVLVAALAAPLAARAQDARAQDARRPVTLIVPFAPGASADGAARVLAGGLGASLGANVVVDNRAGGGGTLGVVLLSQAAPDGTTLGLAATGAMVINPFVPDATLTDPLRRVAPVAKLLDIPLVLVSGRATGLRTLADVVARSRATPEGLSFGSTGTNSSQHLAIEMLAAATGANLVHIPYRGSAPAVTDLLAGSLPLPSWTSEPCT